MRNGIVARFLRYTEERYSLRNFIPLSLIFAITAGICVQKNIYGSIAGTSSIFLSFLAVFLFLLRLRLFDEFKDFAHDMIHYPSRPVPRGLIALGELKAIIVYILCAELLIAASRGAAAGMIFAVALAYSFLMFKEFFVKDWLRNHFTVYIVSHEILAFPLFFYIFSLNGVKLADIGQGYYWLLALFFGCQIFLLEVARKTRAVELEVPSRDTYTAQYGIAGTAVLLICLSVSIEVLVLFMKQGYSGKAIFLDYISLAVLLALFLRVAGFCRHPGRIDSKRILDVSCLFVVTSDVTLIIQTLLKT